MIVCTILHTFQSFVFSFAAFGCYIFKYLFRFIGIRNPRSKGRDLMREMDEVCYDKVHEFVRKGHQVLVFVTARNATTNLAITFRDEAARRVYFICIS